MPGAVDDGGTALRLVVHDLGQNIRHRDTGLCAPDDGSGPIDRRKLVKEVLENAAARQVSTLTDAAAHQSSRRPSGNA